MQSYEANVLNDPPASLVRLAMNAGNMGRLNLHSLLALLLGHTPPLEDTMKLRHIMIRSSQGQVRGVAADLGVPYENVAESCLNQLGVEAGVCRDQQQVRT